MTATTEGAVTVGPEEFVELAAGIRILPGAIKNAKRLMGALEFDTDKGDLLEAQRKELAEALAGDAKRTRIQENWLYAARVSIRLRHGRLARLLAKEKKEGVEPNADVAQRVQTCEALGRKLGVQLDLIDHGEADDEDGEE